MDVDEEEEGDVVQAQVPPPQAPPPQAPPAQARPAQARAAQAPSVPQHAVPQAHSSSVRPRPNILRRPRPLPSPVPSTSATEVRSTKFQKTTCSRFREYTCTSSHYNKTFRASNMMRSWRLIMDTRAWIVLHLHNQEKRQRSSSTVQWTAALLRAHQMDCPFTRFPASQRH